MADRVYASVVNQKNVTQVQLQVLTLIAAQVTNIIEAQIGFALQTDDDILDL
ncbi:hypothetical protein [Clostridium formicaceticum]|uniref:Uncharacterized protein n=1 Tax=Clostridium formicaceticum TaxID=1497 RepID=A0AAC9WGN3_9CLOT|nr:hypothetical protein [Clostridium formicaceticum]ARE88021.1 hypothetical protein CLFO_24220 [Clostridium formicaceticum]